MSRQHGTCMTDGQSARMASAFDGKAVGVGICDATCDAVVGAKDDICQISGESNKVFDLNAMFCKVSFHCFI